MARKKAGEKRLQVGNIREISGEVNIAAGDIYKGFTAEQVSALIEKISTTFQPKKFEGICPYKGLDAFEEEDTELFFGREALVKELVSRVKDSRTVFITGPSGSGKSSLVRAGLIPALKKSSSGSGWLYATLKPGRDPIDALANAFSRLKDPGLGKYLRENAEQASAFHECAESALSENTNQRLVLYIDQFEEVFTQLSKDKAQTFINLLAHAATVENGRVIILFSMRSDFIPNCATYPQLNELLNQQFVQIGAMEPEELVSAIAQPALRVGLRIEPDLIAQIINDMQGEPGALPLMQFALKDLFDAEQAKGGTIALTLDDYLQRGGIHKALERHADEAFNKLDNHEQELARSIFSGLIEVNLGAQDTKRTALVDELAPAGATASDVKGVIQKLATARLVTTSENAVTISHEKLIGAWAWLRRLVNESREAIALQNEIMGDAKEWEEHKRDASYLYGGGRLAGVQEQVKTQKLTLPLLAQDFLRAGKTRQQRTQRTLYSTISIVLIVSILASIAFRNQAREAERQANIALARQLASQAQSLNAARSSKLLTASLLAIKSLQLFPNGDASYFLANNNYSAPIISHMTHRDVVTSVVFSPDGKHIASASADTIIRVWEATSGNELARMQHDAVVSSVAFSPDGKYVVSGSWDGTARVWESASGNELARMIHNSNVTSVAFSPDGKYIVSGSDDNTARVWEASSGNELARMQHDAVVSSVAFSPDGKYVVSGSWDGAARVWESASGNELAQMIHDDNVLSVAFSSDGKYIVSGSWDGTARVWEASSGNELARMIHQSGVCTIAFSLDGKHIVSGDYDGTILVWEASSGNELARMTHDEGACTIAFSPDGKYIVSGSWDGTARVWEASSGNELARMTHDEVVTSVAFSPDGKYIVSGSYDFTACVWDASSEDKLDLITHDDEVTSFSFSPNGKYIVSGSWDGTARVWDASSGDELVRMQHDAVVTSVAFSPDGKYIVSGSADKTARVWDASSGNELARMIHDSNVTSVAFSSDGKYIISGSLDGVIRVWEPFSGHEFTNVSLYVSVNSIVFSPDGKYIALGDDAGLVRVWESSGNELAFMTHENAVNSIAFSPDGKHIVSGSDDNTVRVWEVASGNELVRMTHDDYVTSVAFSPDGKYIVSGSVDKTARVWDASSGDELARITHDGIVNSVAFSTDGKYIVSDGDNNTARVWAWQADDLIMNACAVVTRNLTRSEWQQYIGDVLPYQAVCPNLPIEPELTPVP